MYTAVLEDFPNRAEHIVEVDANFVSIKDGFVIFSKGEELSGALQPVYMVQGRSVVSVTDRVLEPV